MLTVLQAARRTRRHPETIRRWIREGKLRSRKVRSRQLIEEADLEGFFADSVLPGFSPFGREIVAIVRGQRSAH